jgi:hypothetical protein
MRAVCRKKIAAAFDGRLSSDGGVMLLALADPHRIPRCERSERAVLGTCPERRPWQCAPKAQIISGGGFHPDSCRLNAEAGERVGRDGIL